MKIIKLINHVNEDIYINFDNVESYGVVTKGSCGQDTPDEYVGLTYIVPSSMPYDAKPYFVKETPEQITVDIQKMSAEKKKVYAPVRNLRRDWKL